MEKTRYLTIENVERNIENLHYPHIFTKEIGEIFINVQLLSKQLGFDWEKWKGHKIKVRLKEGRKYNTYFIEPSDYGYFKEKTFIIKQEIKN